MNNLNSNYDFTATKDTRITTEYCATLSGAIAEANEYIALGWKVDYVANSKTGKIEKTF